MTYSCPSVFNTMGIIRFPALLYMTEAFSAGVSWRPVLSNSQQTSQIFHVSEPRWPASLKTPPGYLDHSLSEKHSPRYRAGQYRAPPWRAPDSGPQSGPPLWRPKKPAAAMSTMANICSISIRLSSMLIPSPLFPVRFILGSLFPSVKRKFKRGVPDITTGTPLCFIHLFRL